jgi:hypothetical protein
MGSYKVIFKPSVEKDLRSLPQEGVKRILKRIEALKNDPISPALIQKGCATCAVNRFQLSASVCVCLRLKTITITCKPCLLPCAVSPAPIILP